MYIKFIGYINIRQKKWICKLFVKVENEKYENVLSLQIYLVNYIRKQVHLYKMLICMKNRLSMSSSFSIKNSMQ